MKKALSGLFLLIFFFNVDAQPDTVQKIVTGRRNSIEQQEKPYVIMISADGFRYDYADKFGAKNLLRLSRAGVRAKAMIPSYPSLTFPNHYTLVTGLYPAHHGIASNYFYSTTRKQFYSMKDPRTVMDGSWYGGTPLWVLAEEQQMLSASMYWVGSEADIEGIRPTYYYTYNEAIPIERRIQVVVNWLKLPADRRPHFITFYLSQVDHHGHDYGPDDPETARAVRWVDTTIANLFNAVASTGLPVNFIFVSDHGMTKIDNEHPLRIPPAIDSSLFYIPRGFELMELYAKDKSDILPTYKALKKEEKGFKVFLRSNMPSHLHYGEKDDRYNVVGDIMLVPIWPKVFYYAGKNPKPGAHGFDPTMVKDMCTVFYAWGPDFKNNLVVPEFENVDVYPVVTKILGLTNSEKIDGTNEIADKVLK